MTSNKALYFFADNVIEIILGGILTCSLGMTVLAYSRGSENVVVMGVLLAFQVAFAIVAIKADRENKAKWQ